VGSYGVEHQDSPGLSTEELELLRLIGDGLTDEEIAGQLGVARQMVCDRLLGLYVRLGVEGRLALLLLAYTLGIIEQP
jgi:DNA-binding NarL/FixJ family response regulator